MARRQGDDQPPDPVGAHRRELRRDQLDMPVLTYVAIYLDTLVSG
jgi:hypothetical protein